MADKINVNASLASLDVEESRAPFRFALKGNKIISFPDPLDMDFEDAERLLDIVNSNGSIMSAMRCWLSDADFQKLVDAKLTLRQLVALSDKVGAYYADIFGTPGN